MWVAYCFQNLVPCVGFGSSWWQPVVVVVVVHVSSASLAGIHRAAAVCVVCCVVTGCIQLWCGMMCCSDSSAAPRHACVAVGKSSMHHLHQLLSCRMRLVSAGGRFPAWASAYAGVYTRTGVVQGYSCGMQVSSWVDHARALGAQSY